MLECKINPGAILTEGTGMGLHYIDQLGEGIPISRAFMKRYLNRVYGLTDQEYYNIVVYGDIEATPRCPYCGRPKKFWRLINGYYFTCGDYECVDKKHSEDNRRRWSSFTDEEYSEFCKKLGFAGTKDPLLRARAEIGRLLSLYDINTTWYLYLSTINGLNKFGITQNPEARKVKMQYDTIQVYASGNLESMLKFEYDIKSFRHSSSEYFKNDELQSIINFIKLHDQ